MNYTDAIAAHAAQTPNVPAIIEGERILSFGELEHLIRKTASYLRSLGLSEGDHVGIALKDSAPHLVNLFSIARIGAIAVPVDWRAQPGEKLRLAKALDLSLVLTEPNDVDWATDHICVDDTWDRAVATTVIDRSFPHAGGMPCVINVTSGTTGPPRGVIVTHDQIVARFLNWWLNLGFGRGERFLSASPLCFAAGRERCIAQIIGGNTVILYPPLFTADEFVAAVEKFRATVVFLVPTVFRWLLQLPDQERGKLADLKYLITGGAAMYGKEKRDVLQQLCPNFYQSYGASGYSIICCLRPSEIADHGNSVGRPSFGTEVEIVDEYHAAVPAGESGRLRCRGAGMALGFYGSAADAGGHEAFHDGWYYPGELARIDEEGFVYLLGRIASVVVRGGINIYPEEIEHILLLHPAVLEAAVVPMPSTQYGEEICAFIVLRDQHEMSGLTSHCRRHLSPHKVPARFESVEALPKTTSGKVRKSELEAAVASNDQS